MIISERAKHILFFLAVALVYGVTAQEKMYFFGDDVKTLFTQYDYPLLKFSDWHPHHPHRLVDLFYQNIWTNFYLKYVEGALLEPLAGKQHFLDTFRQMSFVSYGLIMSGLCFFSALYVRVFVKLSFKQLAVFAVIFYLFFIQYIYEPSLNGLHARIFVFMVGLGFLYPLFVYALKGRNVFSEWNEYKSAALMLILSYVACFSYFYTMMFISIGALALAIIYCFENYERRDFSSITNLFTKIKTEPKWLLATIISFPIFMLTSALIGANSGRFSFLYGGSYYKFSLGSYKLDKALILLAIVFIIWAWNAYRNKIGRIDKALTFRYGIAALSLLLFIFSFELFHYQLGRSFRTGFDYTRFTIAATALGYGFNTMKQGWAMLPMYFLFFVFAAGGVRAMVSQEYNSKAHYRHHLFKVAVNLSYTFSCYGSKTTPFYNKYYVRKGYGRLPNAKGVYRLEWHRMLARYTRFPPSSKKNQQIVFYFEPSIAKINEQLKVLRETKPWQCARIKNDIYRVKKLDY